MGMPAFCHRINERWYRQDLAGWRRLFRGSIFGPVLVGYGQLFTLISSDEPRLANVVLFGCCLLLVILTAAARLLNR